MADSMSNHSGSVDASYLYRPNHPQTSDTTNYSRDTPLEPLRNPPALISAGFVNKVDNFPAKVRK